MLVRALITVHARLAIAQVVQVLDAGLIARRLRRLGRMRVGRVLAEAVDVRKLTSTFGECRPLVAGTVVAVYAHGVRAKLRKALGARLTGRREGMRKRRTSAVLLARTEAIDLVESTQVFNTVRPIGWC